MRHDWRESIVVDIFGDPKKVSQDVNKLYRENTKRKLEENCWDVFLLWISCHFSLTHAETWSASHPQNDKTSWPVFLVLSDVTEQVNNHWASHMLTNVDRCWVISYAMRILFGVKSLSRLCEDETDAFLNYFFWIFRSNFNVAADR